MREKTRFLLLLFLEMGNNIYMCNNVVKTGQQKSLKRSFFCFPGKCADIEEIKKKGKKSSFFSACSRCKYRVVSLQFAKQNCRDSIQVLRTAFCGSGLTLL